MSEHKRRAAQGSTHTLGDKPIEPDYIDSMNMLARELDGVFNGTTKGADRKTGFVLMVFPFEGPGRGDGRANFISNGANRADIAVLFREMLARFEGQPELTGRG